jgi:hypothetical protein
LKEEALDRTLWRTRFGRGYGPVVRQATEWMNMGNVCRQVTWYYVKQGQNRFLAHYVLCVHYLISCIPSPLCGLGYRQRR